MSEVKIKFENIPVKDREQHLKDHCYHQETSEVKRFYSEHEKDEFRQYCIGFMIEQEKVEDEMEVAMEPFKSKIKSLKSQSKEQYIKVKKGYEVTEKLLFAFRNEVDETMEYYDDLGVFQHSRRLNPDERQAKIFNISKVKEA